MPHEAIPLEAEPPGSTISIAALKAWKINHGEPIPFPPDEDPEHIKLVCENLPKELAHLEGFFSKKEASTLPPSRPGHDVVLELDPANPETGSPPKYRTPIQFLPLEKETIDKLLGMGFIELCMDKDPASVLFVLKLHSSDRRFCIDY